MDEILFRFENFEIYKRAITFVNNIYELTKVFPPEEKYGLTSQLRRSATSIVLNLAEGFGKFEKKDKNRYYKIAKGSLFECVPALKISLYQEYIHKNGYKSIYQDSYELSRRITGLINSVNKRV